MERLEKLRQGNRRALAKAITLIESTLDTDREQAQELLEQVFQQLIQFNQHSFERSSRTGCQLARTHHGQHEVRDCRCHADRA